MEVRDASPGYAPQVEMPVVPESYKQTEVGVIPEEWEVRTLGEVSTFLDGQRRPVKASDRAKMSGTIPYYGASGVVDYINDYLFDEELILLGEDGENILSRNLRLAFRISGKSWVNNHAHVIRPNSDISIGFLTEYLESLDYSGLNSGTAQPKLNKQKCLAIHVAVPPIVEQRAIATALSDVDALLEALDRLIAKKRDIKQATMQQLLTGQTRLPGFEGEWALFNMAKNSTLKARIGWQGLTTAEYLKLGDYGLVTGTDFNDGKVVWEGCYFVEKNRYEQDKNIQLKPNDVLVTKDGTIGKAAYIDELPFPATLNSGVFVIRPSNDSYHPKYFYYVLMSQVFTDFLNKLAAGSTISHLYQKDFVNFEFPAPTSKEEQIAIATILSDIDTELEALHQRRTKTAALKQAMMQELLTGRTRLVGLQVGAEAGE